MFLRFFGCKMKSFIIYLELDRSLLWINTYIGAFDTLLRGIESCSAVARCLSWPCSQATSCKWAAISCPAQLLVSTTVGPLNRNHWKSDSATGQWRGGHQMESQVRGTSGLLRKPSSLAGFGSVGELEGPGSRLGTLSCRAPEPSGGPSTSLGPGHEAAVRLCPICVCVY